MAFVSRIYSFPQTGFWNKVSLVERCRGNVPVLLVWGWEQLVMLRSHDGLEAALGITTPFPLIAISAGRWDKAFRVERHERLLLSWLLSSSFLCPLPIFLFLPPNWAPATFPEGCFLSWCVVWRQGQQGGSTDSVPWPSTGLRFCVAVPHWYSQEWLRLWNCKGQEHSDWASLTYQKCCWPEASNNSLSLSHSRIGSAAALELSSNFYWFPFFLLLLVSPVKGEGRNNSISSRRCLWQKSPGSFGSFTCCGISCSCLWPLQSSLWIQGSDEASLLFWNGRKTVSHWAILRRNRLFYLKVFLKVCSISKVWGGDPKNGCLSSWFFNWPSKGN